MPQLRYLTFKEANEFGKSLIGSKKSILLRRDGQEWLLTYEDPLLINNDYLQLEIVNILENLRNELKNNSNPQIIIDLIDISNEKISEAINSKKLTFSQEDIFFSSNLLSLKNSLKEYIDTKDEFDYISNKHKNGISQEDALDFAKIFHRLANQLSDSLISKIAETKSKELLDKSSKLISSIDSGNEIEFNKRKLKLEIENVDICTCGFRRVIYISNYRNSFYWACSDKPYLHKKINCSKAENSFLNGF